MSRPRRSQQTRTAILEKGTAFLSEQGYNGTGLKQILDAVQVPKGSFYNFFSSKEDFAAEIIHFYSGQLLDQFQRLIESSDQTPLNTIRSAYKTMASHFQNNDCRQGCLLGNLAGELGGSSELCRQALQESFSNWKQVFVALLLKGQEAGEIRDDIRADTLADLFWNCWEGSLLRMKIDGNTDSLVSSLDLMLDSVMQRHLLNNNKKVQVPENPQV